MKYKITIATLLFFTLSVSAQITQKDLEKEIKPLVGQLKTVQSQNKKLKSDVAILKSQISRSNKRFDSLQNQTLNNTNAIATTNSNLGIKIKESGDHTEGKIAEVSKSLSKNSLYGIIGILLAMMLTGLLYWLLNKKQKTDKTDLIDELSKTKSSIEESLVKEFGKQTELMDTQLHLLEQQKTTSPTTPNTELNHSLALKLADEITLIERNISLMDTATKGLKQLSRSVSKLKDNLAANGYEMPELLGMLLNRGMHAIPVNTIPDENLEPGVEKITKIIKPQVNYNDKMIQAAQIEVSVGY